MIISTSTQKDLAVAAMKPGLDVRYSLIANATLMGGVLASTIGGIGIAVAGTAIGIPALAVTAIGAAAGGFTANKLLPHIDEIDEGVTPEDAYSDDQADKAYAAADFTDPWTVDDCPF